MDGGMAPIHYFEYIRHWHRGRIVGMRNQTQLPYIVFVRKEKENQEKEQEDDVCICMCVCVCVCVFDSVGISLSDWIKRKILSGHR